MSFRLYIGKINSVKIIIFLFDLIYLKIILRAQTEQNLPKRHFLSQSCQGMVIKKSMSITYEYNKYLLQTIFNRYIKRLELIIFFGFK